MDEPKVSVSIITYNHESFIAQALDSVLMQETDFDFEILVGEDDSEDGTRDIVKAYKDRYPDRISLFLNDRANVIYIDGQPTGRWNFLNNIGHARGKYVALLDGDDFWTDPCKLQKQADFLDDHPDMALCFHHIHRFLQSTGEMIVERPKRQRPYYLLGDLIGMKVHIPTVSVMFRNDLITRFPAWFYSAPFGDLPLFVLLAQHGRIGLLDQSMAVYRVHCGGAWQGADKLSRMQMWLRTMSMLKIHLGPNYEQQIDIPVSIHFLNRSQVSADRGDMHTAKFFLRKSIGTSFSLKGKWFDQLVLFARLYAPPLYKVVKWLLGSG